MSGVTAGGARRSTNIDLCRGLLFVLMTNTHALALLGVAGSHFLVSDWWLPGGWATVVFVVLSGFSVGFVLSDRRDPLPLERALLRRSRQILAVMLVSNTVFALLRDAMAGKLALVATPGWWIGFLTLETDWTISGVLFPTALVVALGVPVYRMVQRSPWLALPVLLALQLACTLVRVQLKADGATESWWLRFLFLQGFGGFPVLPFVLNGLLGLWLGVMRNVNELQWRRIIVLLLVLQLGVYLTSLFPALMATSLLVAGAGAIGKFAWMYLAAHLLKLSGLFLARPIELLGAFALGSFVMHRFFLQALNLAMSKLGIKSVAVELRYALLLGLTLLLTWGLCALRKRYLWLDTPFRRLAL